MYEMYVTSERKGANLSNQIGDQYNRVVHETNWKKQAILYEYSDNTPIIVKVHTLLG